MKKFFHFAGFMAIAIAATFFTACSSDDDGGNKGGSTPSGSVEVTAIDQVEYMQNNIVEIDQKGNMVQRVNGAVLNPADTTEIYIGVEDFDAASVMFKSLYGPPVPTPPMPARPNANARSTANMSVPLTDENGIVKETAYFNAVDDGPVIAEVTFATNKVMKHFSKIKFIKQSAWPNNDESEYVVGDTATFETANEGKQKWVCIREAKCGVSGLMMYISQQECDFSASRLMNCASQSLAETASEILRANWTMYVTYFNKAGSTLDDSYYWIGSCVMKSPAISLQNGDIRSFEAPNDKSNILKKHYIQIRTFGV